MTATDELKPCPLCGKEVYGQLCGGSGLFSDEYEYEIECKCGLLFNAGPFRTPKKAKAEAVKMWNRRTHERD